MTEVVIRSEEEAFEWLEKYLEGELDSSEIQRVHLEGWPTLTIRLTGEKFDQSLTPSVMKGFVDLQSAINRSVALSKTGEPNAGRLSAEERNALEIRVRVERGSSLLHVDFTGLLSNLGTKAIAAMDPTTLAMTLVGLAAIWGGTTVSKQFLSDRSKERMEKIRSDVERDRLQQLQTMSQEETKRMELITRLQQKNVELENAARFAEDARVDLLKTISKADVAEFAGFEFDSDLAKELVKNARRKSEEVRLDGEYRILRNDTTDPSAFKVKVRNVATDQEFEALVQDESLTQPIKTALQKAEWERAPIKLKINAKALEDTIRNAIVIGLVSDES